MMNLRVWKVFVTSSFICFSFIALAGDEPKTKKAKPIKPSAKAAPKTKSDASESAIFQEIDRVRGLASKIKIDGKRGDWKDIPGVNAPRGDAKGDGSRNIVRVAIAPREKDWSVMIATAQKTVAGRRSVLVRRRFQGVRDL